MNYEDMSSYEYKLNFSLSGFYNVGWIDKPGEYDSDRSKELVEKLVEILLGKDSCKFEFNLLRGPAHACEICGEREVKVKLGDKEHFLGCSELMVPDEKNGFFYVSPSMIIHYIEKHGYLPPESFCDAVHAVDMARPFDAYETYLDALVKQKTAG